MARHESFGTNLVSEQNTDVAADALAAPNQRDRAGSVVQNRLAESIELKKALSLTC